MKPKSVAWRRSRAFNSAKRPIVPSPDRDSNETKTCACGCGAIIFRWRRSAFGRTKSIENIYAKNHDKRKGIRGLNETKPCECGCGTSLPRWKRSSKGTTLAQETRFATGHHLLGKKRSPETNAKISAAHKGRPGRRREKHWNWKGGVTEANRLERNTPEYHEWRKAVYVRDHFTCQMPSCGKKLQADEIIAHHYLTWLKWPEFRFEVWNGVTLCRNCHADLHGLGTYVRPLAEVA